MNITKNHSSIKLDFFTSLETIEPNRRFQSFMEYRLAPVMEGAKPAELIMLCPGLYDLHDTWLHGGKEMIEETGLECLTLKERADCACVLVYDKASLSRYLDAEWETPLMRNAGYRQFEEHAYLSRLKDRFADRCPHEIGLFLGFPYDDVDEFIKNSGRQYLFNGYWKVYCKPDRARTIFHKYDSAKIRAIERFRAIDGIGTKF
jgi:hypothetical protein